MGEYFTNKLGGPVGSGIVEELVGLSRFNDFPFVHEDNPVGHLAGKSHLVGNHAHGHPLFGQLNHNV